MAAWWLSAHHIQILSTQPTPQAFVLAVSMRVNQGYARIMATVIMARTYVTRMAIKCT